MVVGPNRSPKENPHTFYSVTPPRAKSIYWAYSIGKLYVIKIVAVI